MNNMVLIVHRLRFVREGLIQLLHAKSGIDVVADAADGSSALELAGRHRPHLALVDHDLQGMSALELTRTLRHRETPIPVVIMGMRLDMQSFTNLLQAGATGFLREDFTVREVIDAMNCLLKGEVYITQSLRMLNVPPTQAAEVKIKSHVPVDNLTERQREILAMVADGRTTKEIAADLSISPKTVDTHRKDLMARLNIYSVAQLTKYALREGLTTLVD